MCADKSLCANQFEYGKKPEILDGMLYAHIHAHIAVLTQLFNASHKNPRVAFVNGAFLILWNF